MPIMSPGTPTDDAMDLINRLRTVLLRVDIDCGSRDSLSDALDRFAALEKRRLTRHKLAEARDLRNRIGAILTFLSELDQVSEGERDRSVFEEMALLFIEIVSCAITAAAALRGLDSKL